MNLGCHGLSDSLPVPCWDDTNMQATYRKKLHHINLPGHSHELTFSCYRRLPLLRESVGLHDSIRPSKKQHIKKNGENMQAILNVKRNEIDDKFLYIIKELLSKNYWDR